MKITKTGVIVAIGALLFYSHPPSIEAGPANSTISTAPEVMESISTEAANSTPAEPLTYNPQISLAPLVELLGPAVVNINVEQQVSNNRWSPYGAGRNGRIETGLGSGFIISSDGLILTNHHVVDDADYVMVTLADERTFQAEVLGSDYRTDVALVKIEDSAGFPFVELGDSDGLSVGDWVIAIGNPFGLSQTVTAGIVSALGREIGAGPYDDFIQTDASINPGNSGGPLFNLQGEVVGMNTAISSQGQGIGFAVPVDMVRDVMTQLQEHGEVQRGWIGVSLSEDEGLVKGKGEPESGEDGVFVAEVYSGTPGDLAGLVVGDTIISIDGEPVTSSNEVIRTVGLSPPGETLVFRIVRQDLELDLPVTLQIRPDDSALSRGQYGAGQGRGK